MLVKLFFFNLEIEKQRKKREREKERESHPLVHLLTVHKGHSQELGTASMSSEPSLLPPRVGTGEVQAGSGVGS